MTGWRAQVCYRVEGGKRKVWKVTKLRGDVRRRETGGKIVMEERGQEYTREGGMRDAAKERQLRATKGRKES